MPYLELTVDNVAAHFWQSGRYFFRQYEIETKAKRIFSSGIYVCIRDILWNLRFLTSFPNCKPYKK